MYGSVVIFLHFHAQCMSEPCTRPTTSSPVAIETVTSTSPSGSLDREVTQCTLPHLTTGGDTFCTGSPRSDGFASSDEAKSVDCPSTGFEGPEKVSVSLHGCSRSDGFVRFCHNAVGLAVELIFRVVGCALPCQVLELEFSTVKGPIVGLRALVREQWDAVLSDAKCTILCTMSNEHFDSYVLSESSLFVYPHTVVLKTCGTTTLLRCIPRLLEYTTVSGVDLKCCGLSVVW